MRDGAAAGTPQDRPAAGWVPSAEELYSVVREGVRDPGSGRYWWGEWENSVNPFHARYQKAFEKLRDFISTRAVAPAPPPAPAEIDEVEMAKFMASRPPAPP
jgi:hypothetical protein